MIRSCWSWRAAGHGVLLVMACCWSWRAAGHGVLLVMACCWSWRAAGHEYKSYLFSGKDWTETDWTEADWTEAAPQLYCGQHDRPR